MTGNESKVAMHDVVMMAAENAVTSDDVRNPKRHRHVVIVDEEFPFPLNSGKRIRTANLRGNQPDESIDSGPSCKGNEYRR